MKVAGNRAKVKTHKLLLRKLDQGVETDIQTQNGSEDPFESLQLPQLLSQAQPIPLLPLPILLQPQRVDNQMSSTGEKFAAEESQNMKNVDGQARKSIEGMDVNLEEKKIKDDLTEFVEAHVVLMLKKLYAKIKIEESSLQDSSSLDSARKWMKKLLSTTQNNTHLLGPVGERPLHVCSLSAYRFGPIDILGQGNYMKDGILNGMKKFVEKESVGRQQVHVPYGKDYCGLIFACISTLKDCAKYKWSESEKSIGNQQSPPFWSALQVEYEVNCKTKCSCFGVENRSWKKEMLTLGIYEGETIAHPMIASGDLSALYWILKEEKREKIGKGRYVDPARQRKPQFDRLNADFKPLPCPCK
jgi:hypothetical protein